MSHSLASELAALIGRRAVVELGGLRVAVRVREAKTSYGRPRVWITPEAGDTEQGTWIDAARLIPHLEAEP